MVFQHPDDGHSVVNQSPKYSWVDGHLMVIQPSSDAHLMVIQYLVNGHIVAIYCHFSVIWMISHWGAPWVHLGCTNMCNWIRVKVDPRTWAPHSFTPKYIQGPRPIDMPSPMHSLSIPYYFEGLACGFRVGGFSTTHSDMRVLLVSGRVWLFNQCSNLIVLIKE